MRGSTTSIRTRLIGLVLVAALPFLGLIIYSAYEVRIREEDRAREKVEILARVLSSDYYELIGRSEQLLNVISTSRDLAPTNAREVCEGFLKQFIRGETPYVNLGVVGADGYLRCSVIPPKSEPLFLGEEGYFQQALESRSFSIGQHQTSVIVERPTVDFGLPLYFNGQDPWGVLFVSVDVTWINRAADAADLPHGSIFFVADESGKIVSSHVRGLAQPVEELIAVKELRSSSPFRQEGTSFITGTDGVNRIVITRSLYRTEGGPFYASVAIPAKAVFKESGRLLTRNLVFLLIVTILSLGLAHWISTIFVLKHLHRLNNTVRRMAAGELGARAKVLDAPVEIAELGASLNTMSTTLEQHMRELEEAKSTIAQRAEELSRSRAEIQQVNFLASYHMQDPVVTISSHLKQLAKRCESKLDPNSREYLRQVEKAAFRMKTLVDDLLIYSGTENEEFALEATDINLMVEHAMAELDEAIKDAEALILIEPLPTLTVNAEQMIELFRNLIDNAIKYRAIRRPKIRVYAQHQGDEWVFAVNDNGIGIDPQYHADIFKIYGRIHEVAAYVGTGVGLAICKKIVQRYGGKIWVESEVGIGSTFFFSIPDDPARYMKQQEEFRPQEVHHDEDQGEERQQIH